MAAPAERSGPPSAAALFAGRAPSLHNSQPWHWYVRRDELDLRLETRRVLRSSDPAARLAVLSCGVALHHARIHLAAAGLRARVSRLPECGDADLLARLRLDGEAPIDHDAARLVRAAAHRRTDRRGWSAAPVDLDRVRLIRQAVAGQGAELVALRPRQVFDLAAAIDAADDRAAAAPARQAELADWIGGERPLGTGIPDAALPADPSPVTVPARALRLAGATLIAESRHRAAVFAVLRSSGDARPDWLAAGEGLSAGWLTATALDVAVLPLSIVAEVASGRDRVRDLLDRHGYPQLVLRLAAGADDGARQATPRLPATAFISYD